MTRLSSVAWKHYARQRVQATKGRFVSVKQLASIPWTSEISVHHGPPKDRYGSCQRLLYVRFLEVLHQFYHQRHYSSIDMESSRTSCPRDIVQLRLDALSTGH